MVILAIPLQLIFAVIAARWFKRHAPKYADVALSVPKGKKNVN
jgi:hypothetical protein